MQGLARRYVVIHGHFYQPPRENPWTEVIERQPSAGADHDWNERIARECYIPNGRARIAGGDNQTLDVINNYERLSFNFGPTLMSWYERYHPKEYARVLEADASSLKRLEGHGNAIAQAYNHMILPLAHPADRLTQIRWGLEDFKARFRRAPEALWLAETACDDATLRALIDEGLRYALLAPSQALRVRHGARAGDAWIDVSDGSVDTRRPYRWWSGQPGKSKFIDLFFYDGMLSQAVAFGHLMRDSRQAAAELARRFDAREEPQLLSICTDGETYGHHERFADMGLAHLLSQALAEQGLEAVNFGWFLSKHPPVWQAQIKPGPQGLGTSWSCSHGVARWMSDCNCGAQPGQQTRWRAALRETLDWLRLELAEIFEGQGAGLFKSSPWRARDEYVKVLLDAAGAAAAAYWKEHLSPGADALQARRLLEMQKFAMFMYTSCGWFFGDVSGIEAAQNLRYCARAIELARLAGGRDLEEPFLRRLEKIPSNDSRYGDAAGVYRRACEEAGRRDNSSRA